MAPLTEEQMLTRGLLHLGVTPKEWGRRCRRTNEEDFATHFGPPPKVVADLWTRLHTTENADARIDPKIHRVKDFLTALHWLKIYPKERERKISIKVGRDSGRKWSWFYAAKIGALKAELVVWPESWDTIFTMTIDGVHFCIKEPTDDVYKFVRGVFSHKFGSAGLDYEIAISTFTQQVVHIAGPFRAGRNDVQIFREEGLKEKIPDGCYAIADRGYREKIKPSKIRTQNYLDDDDVAMFKAEALARHETFNSRLERYSILQERFRSNMKTEQYEKHGIVFNAVAVICQLEMMLGSPLFDV